MEERQDSLLEATRDRVSESQEIKVSRFRWHFQLKAGAKGRKRKSTGNSKERNLFYSFAKQGL